jgi:creatinine amidohydrolase
MKYRFPLVLLLAILSMKPVLAQQLHTRWDELTAADWPKALQLSDSTCILPMGILEKHGLHDPIGGYSEAIDK